RDNEAIGAASASAPRTTLALLDRGEVMCPQERDQLKNGTQEPEPARNAVCQRWGERYPPHVNVATAKQLVEFELPNASNVRVARIVHKEVVPENEPTWFEDPQHLKGYVVPQSRVENRTEDGELCDQIEGVVPQRQVSSVGTDEVQLRCAQPFSLLNGLGKQVQADDVLGARSPLGEFAEPVPSPT